MINYNETSNELKIYHTNNIEATWRMLKDMIPKRNRNKDDLPKYLLEQIWRRQNKQYLQNLVWIRLIRNNTFIRIIYNFEVKIHFKTKY